jgi:hypothetical protein
MTTKPFDQFNKRLFQELLSPFGQVTSNFAVPGEERAVDIFFVPNIDRRPDSNELGRLASMLNQPALLEPFRSQLKDTEVCNCLIKLFLVQAGRQRQTEREDQPLPSGTQPYLWILAAAVSDRLIADFGGRLDVTLGDGFYCLPPRLQTTIIAIEELPTTPDTLWLRLLGRGRTQENAITELLLLPESDPKRSSALSLLVSWRISMEVMEQVDSEERRILMALSQAYQEWEQQTRRQGLQQERQAAIASLMRLRFGEVDEDLQAIIPALTNLPAEEYTQLLWQLSRDELLQRFTDSSSH